jgi:hypothetical protein
VEEMQLVSAGIGPDRVSDIAANILKAFLIEYTQKQCEIWSIRVQPSVPLAHIYDPELQGWVDGYYDLPVSEADGSPILFVPRRIVRTLPWINYDDFVRSEFRNYLAAKRAQAARGKRGSVAKAEVVSVTRQDMALVHRYVKAKEQAAADARPTLDYLDADACEQAEKLKARLASIPTGVQGATDYQILGLEILNYLFNPISRTESRRSEQ